VRFPGCRPNERNSIAFDRAGISVTDSAWLRVVTPWAGERFGVSFIPRVGMTVRVEFQNGDPDRPIVTGATHSGPTPPPAFSRVSALPAERYLSGIVSREVRGRRGNQLRLDDTPGQISAQLASEHGAAQLNLGYLTHPRQGGRGAARGEGFELATTESGSIRTAKSLLISAWKRLDTQGKQLSSEEHIALMQDCLDLFKSLGQYAADHQALALDPAPQAELKSDVAAAEGGSNTAPEGQPGKPTLSISAPAGLAFTTPKTIVSYAGVNLDTVAQQHMQLTAGQRFNLNAGKGISLFAHHDGITQIAHHGTFLMQSQHQDMQLDSATDIKMTAGRRLVIMAEQEIVLMVGGGAYLKLKGGAVEIGGPGALHVKTDGHYWDGPASNAAELPSFGEGNLGRTPRLLRPTDGKPVEGMQVHVEREGAAAVSGVSDSAGKAGNVITDRLQQLKVFFYRPRK
jgi:type VI secretion system secreted protein VgrG